MDTNPYESGSLPASYIFTRPVVVLSHGLVALLALTIGSWIGYNLAYRDAAKGSADEINRLLLEIGEYQKQLPSTQGT